MRQGGITKHFSVVFYHPGGDIGSAHHNDHTARSGDRGVQQVACHKHRRAGVHRYYYDGILASLTLMHCNSIGKLELVEKIEGILGNSVVEAYEHLIGIVIYLKYLTDIAVEETDADSTVLLPFYLVIVRDLHNSVSLSEYHAVGSSLTLEFSFRI